MSNAKTPAFSRAVFAMTRREGQGVPPQTTLSRYRLWSLWPATRSTLPASITRRRYGSAGGPPAPLGSPRGDAASSMTSCFRSRCVVEGRAGVGGMSFLDPYLPRVLEAEDESLVAGSRLHTRMRLRVVQEGHAPHLRPRSHLNPSIEGVSRNSTGRRSVEGGGGGPVLPGPLSSACPRSRKRKSRGGAETPHTNATQGGPGRTCPPPPPAKPPQSIYPLRGSREIRWAGAAWRAGVGGVPSLDPYLLRVLEAEDESLVAGQRLHTR